MNTMNTIKITITIGSWSVIRATLDTLRRINFDVAKASPDLTFSGIEVRTFVGDIATPRAIAELKGRELCVAHYYDKNRKAFRHGPVIDATSITERAASVAAVQALCDYYNNEPELEQLSELNLERLQELMNYARQHNTDTHDKRVLVLNSGNNIRPFRVMDSTGIQFNTDYEMAVAMLNLETSKKAA